MNIIQCRGRYDQYDQDPAPFVLRSAVGCYMQRREAFMIAVISWKFAHELKYPKKPTSFAIELARRFKGEIIGADSMQLYRHMDIGTAKPTTEEQAAVTHHLVDVIDPDSHASPGRLTS